MKSENIFLRAVEPHDIDFIFELENNPNNWSVSSTLIPFSRYAIEQYVLNIEPDIFAQKQLRLIIALSASTSNDSIGCIDLFDIDALHKRAGIGIIILDKYRSRGYGNEALKLMIVHAFSRLQLHQLYCNISANNSSSVSLFKKNGFVESGIKKDWICENQSWIDEFFFQLINTQHGDKNK